MRISNITDVITRIIPLASSGACVCVFHPNVELLVRKGFRVLNVMQNEFGQFRVYIVEVCRNCHWNHLHLSYLLGDGQERKAPRKVRTLEDEDWVS